MRRRRASERIMGKLVVSALLWVVNRVLAPVPVLRAIVNVVAFAAA